MADNTENTPSVDSNTMNILRSAMSTQAALTSMGFGQENDEFAKMMAERDRKASTRRAESVMPSPPPVEQKPVVSSRRKNGGMRRQSLQPETAPQTGIGADGLTDDQRELVNRVQQQARIAEEEYKSNAIAEYEAEKSLGDEPKSFADVMDQLTDAPYVPAAARSANPMPTPEPKPIPVQEVTRAKFDPSTPDGDFRSFVEIVGWPSRGLAYTDRIYGQALTLGDMFMLGYMNESNNTDIMDTIIGRHIRGIQAPYVLSCDEVYLMHWLRASSYPRSGMFGPKYICKECKFDVSKSEMANYTIGFNDLVFVTSADPSEIIPRHKEKGFVDIVTYDGRECDIYLRRRLHDAEIINGKREWEKRNGKAFPIYMNMAITMAAVVEIEDCDGILEKLDYIWEYPTSKRKEFMDAISESSLSTTVKARIKCPSCGGVADWPYPFRVKEFLSGL